MQINDKNLGGDGKFLRQDKYETGKFFSFIHFYSNLMRIDKKFPLIFSAVERSTVQSNSFPPTISAAPPK